MSASFPHQAARLDWVQLRALLRCYWRLATRGKLTAAMGRGRAGKQRGLTFVAAMYVLTGLTASAQVMAHIDVFTFALVLHSMTFFIVGMAATSESGDILFSPSESDALLHRPIHPRTLLLAKWVNLIGLSAFLAGALNLFPTFFGLAARGARWWFPLAHVASIFLLSVFCSVAVVCTYGLIVRFFDREKFDNFAAWTQVAMSFLFIGGYQFLPRLMGRFDRLSLDGSPYMFPWPPAWFAAFDAIGCAETTRYFHWALAAMGLAVTGALTYSAVGKLAPSYGEALAKLGETRPRPPAPKRTTERTRRQRNRVMSWWLRDPIERASFRLATAYMRHDRETKLRLYPSLSSFVIFPIMGLLDRHTEVSAFIPLMTVWTLGTLPVMAMETLRSSSQAAAADIFATAPLESAASIFFGVRKATIFFLLLPALCVAAALIMFLGSGGERALVLALPGVVAIPSVSLLPGCLDDYLPLSRLPRIGGQSSKNVVVMFGTMISMGVLAALSYLAWKMEFMWAMLAVEIVLVALVNWLLIRRVRARRLLWE